jgi:PKD repeat protein
MRNHFSNTVTFAPANQPPKAAVAVTPTSGTAALTVTASTASSADPDGKIASSKINFGDGSATVSASSANHTYSAAGTYTLTATLTDNAGASSQATAKVTVSAPTTTASCAINKTNRTVTICSPLSGGSYKSAVRVVASATDSVSVAYMQIYVDGIKVYQLNNAKSINTSVSMKVGSHRVTVQAKDATGTFWKTATITVTL